MNSLFMNVKDDEKNDRGDLVTSPSNVKVHYENYICTAPKCNYRPGTEVILGGLFCFSKFLNETTAVVLCYAF